MTEGASKRYERKAKARGVDEEIDVLAELDESEREETQENDRKRRLHVVGRARFVTQEIDPFEQLGIVPRTVPRWQTRIPATEKQRGMLERNGLRLPRDLDTGRASQLIEALMSKPTEKQAWFIRRAGLDPSGLDRKSASSVIDMLKQNRHDDARATVDRIKQPS